jgi:hypothetical protein
LQQKQQLVAHRSTALRKLMFSLRAQAQDAKLQFVHYRQQDLKLELSQIQLQLHIMVAVHRSHVEFKERERINGSLYRSRL